MFNGPQCAKPRRFRQTFELGDFSLSNTMFGGKRSAISAHAVVDMRRDRFAVTFVPGCQIYSDRGLDVKMDVAVAQMPKGKGFGAGIGGFNHRGFILNETGHRRHGDADIMLQRRSRRALSLCNGIADFPECFGLRVATRNGCVAE